jgi:Meiotically up-regulated gene 113
MTHCYLYAIVLDCPSDYNLGELESAHFKIGISANPESRLSQLRANIPFPLHIEKIWLLPHRFVAQDIEASIHDAFSHCNTSGEWFLHPIKDAIRDIDNILKEAGHETAPTPINMRGIRLAKGFGPQIDRRISKLTTDYGKRVGEMTPDVVLAAKATAILEYARRAHRRGDLTREMIFRAEAAALSALNKIGIKMWERGRRNLSLTRVDTENSPSNQGPTSK